MKPVKEAIDPCAVGPPVHGTPRTGDMRTGLCASVLLHVAAVTGVLLTISTQSPARNPLLIDLTIGGPWGSGVSGAPAPAKEPRHGAETARREPPSPVPDSPLPAPPVPVAAPGPLPEPQRELAPVSPPVRPSDAQAPATASAAGVTERSASAATGSVGVSSDSTGTAAAAVSVPVPAGGGSPRGASPGATTSRAAPGTGAGTEEPGEARAKAGGRYLERHYAYIRDAIQQGISYPPMARRMGWEGKVVVAFLVLSDGSVRDVRVVRGSGHPALDRGAVEAVRKAAPFPRPPAEAEIITPVVYRLD